MMSHGLDLFFPEQQPVAEHVQGALRGNAGAWHHLRGGAGAPQGREHHLVPRGGAGVVAARSVACSGSGTEAAVEIMSK